MADKLRHRLLIDSFLSGEIGLDDLTKRLPAALAVTAETPSDHRAYLDQLRASGRLPPQLHALLSTLKPAASSTVDRSPILLDRPLPSAGKKATQRRRGKTETESPLAHLLQDAMPARTIVPRYDTQPAGAQAAAVRAEPANIPPEFAPDHTSDVSADIPLDIPPDIPLDIPSDISPDTPAPRSQATAPEPAAPSGPTLGFAPRPSRQATPDPALADTPRPTAEATPAAPAARPARTGQPAAEWARDLTADVEPEVVPDTPAGDGRTNTVQLPDDYDPMEGLVVTTPAPARERDAGRDIPARALSPTGDAASPSPGTDASSRDAGPLPSSLLPEAAMDPDAAAPTTVRVTARSTSGGAMPLPTQASASHAEGPAPDTPADDTPADDTPAKDTPEGETEARVDEAIFAKYLSTYRSLKDQRAHDAAAGENQKLDALLQPWQTIRFRRDAGKLAEGDSGAVGDFGLDEQDGPADIGPGDIVNKRFVIERVLGEGGMGTVFKAVDRRQLEAKSPNPFVALKLLSHDFRRHPEAYRALERETRKTQILAHPNIVTVFDFDRDGRVAYMTMELLDGIPLSDRLHSSQKSMDWKDVEPIIRGVGAALSYAHEQGIVHADIKPGNIFIMSDGRTKLLDFGIAQAFRDSTSPADGENALAGALTPGFASVEMLEGMPAAPKDDIYAFACVIYEMMTGHHPFDGKTANEAEASGDKPSPIASLSRKQNAALADGLAFRREGRPATMQSFIEELIEVKRGWFGR